MRILVAEPLAREGVDMLRARHEVDERIGLAPADLRAIAGDYEGLLVRSQVQVDAAMIAASQKLVVIGRAGVGIDNVDVAAATRAGITVVKKHVPGPQGVRGRNSDNSLLRQVLGWEPQISLEEGLARTYPWIEEQVAATLTDTDAARASVIA